MKQNGFHNEVESFTKGDPYRVAYLIAGYIRQTLTEKEHDELDEWVAASDDNNRLFGELTDEQNIETAIDKIKALNPELSYQQLRQKIGLRPEPKKIRNRLWAYGVAASVLVASSFVIYYFSSKPSNAPTQKISGAVEPDIAPGGNNAILTLSNGQTIDLTRADTGLIKNESGALISKTTDGQLYYVTSSPFAEVKYNTLTTPNGGQYMIVLPDGTMVWLNAASSLRYPVAFSGKERIVELTGEGYFEVASAILPNQPGRQPFIVETKDARIEVLGTRFNVNAYENEEGLTTTLLEGNVKVSDAGGKESEVLKPRQQAVCTSGNPIKIYSNVSTDAVTAWKDGLFIFKDTDIKMIMRQVERWYNTKVEYSSEVEGHFNGTISRSVPVSKLLHYLELTRQVDFGILDNKIIVSNTSQKEKK